MHNFVRVDMSSFLVLKASLAQDSCSLVEKPDYLKSSLMNGHG